MLSILYVSLSKVPALYFTKLLKLIIMITAMLPMTRLQYKNQKRKGIAIEPEPQLASRIPEPNSTIF